MAQLLQFPTIHAPKFNLYPPSKPETESDRFWAPSQLLAVYARLCPISKYRLCRRAADAMKFTEMEILEAEAKAVTDKVDTSPIDLDSN